MFAVMVSVIGGVKVAVKRLMTGGVLSDVLTRLHQHHNSKAACRRHPAYQHALLVPGRATLAKDHNKMYVEQARV
jgi:hypothetical protein